MQPSHRVPQGQNSPKYFASSEILQYWLGPKEWLKSCHPSNHKALGGQKCAPDEPPNGKSAEMKDLGCFEVRMSMNRNPASDLRG